MKTLLPLSVLMILGLSPAVSQDCEGYLSFQEGNKVKYALTDKKNKPAGTVEYVVESVNRTGGGLAADMRSKFTDEKGKEISNSTFTIACKGEKLILDLKSMLNDQMLEAFKGMTMKAEGGNMDIPFSAAVGSLLPDASLHMDILNEGQDFATIDIIITNRKVEAKEEVTTPAGNFSSIRISYDSETKIRTLGIGVPMNVHSITWYSREVGTVRSDSYSKDMKPLGNMVLSEVIR
jgi:hypothetical protein